MKSSDSPKNAAPMLQDGVGDEIYINTHKARVGSDGL